ncbi:hypothetical protein CPB83DRAFT_885899 [Crepidotus variabilis]|uniref:Uncharacterized protein n=1 Tax=Crepidotus variabilis TaxID=179855 RepID=A0A9P6E9L4_9AGAR|nr:hypothetical protein CPB83DRAFT_885899 [Crepidotus variabilis]
MTLIDSTLSTLDGQADSKPEAPAIATGPKLTSLVPILQKLDTSLIFESGKYYIPNNLPAECWAKLRDYAATVEELAISNAESTIPNSTYIQWARRQGCSVLLARIKNLHVTYERDTSSSFDISLFLSPSLSELHVDHPSDEAQLQLSFALIEPNLLNLTHLSILNLELVPRLLDAILSSCQLLDTLELGVVSGGLNYRQVRRLLASPFLQLLQISLDGATTYEQEPINEHHDAHGEVRQHHLSVRVAGHPDFNIDVLRAAQYNSCCLTSVSLDWKNWHVDNAKMNEILQQCPQDIHGLRLHGPGLIDFSESLLSQQITKFHNLKTLVFPLSSVLGPPNHWDTQLKLFLPLWSLLEELSLPSREGIRYTVSGNSVSVSSIKLIAQGCSNLIKLRACVHNPTSYEHSAEFSTCILTHPLRKLNLHSPHDPYRGQKVVTQSQAFSIARYLYALFPKLENVDACESAWKPIAETILLLKNVCHEAYLSYEQETQKLKAKTAP